LRAYVIRRLGLVVITLFLVTIIAFLSVRFIPGSLVDLMVADKYREATASSEEMVAAVKEQLGLDVPIWKQYLRWLGAWPQKDGSFSGVLEGDLGKSLWTERIIRNEIFQRVPISLELGIIALITALMMAFPIGIYSAIRQDTIGDYLGRSFAILCIAIPGFWLATMIFIYPSKWFHWTPPVIYIPITENFGANLGQFIIPGILMGIAMSGTTMRMTRTMMLEVLRQDYIRTAWSKGLRERVVVLKHALKNSLIPIITIIGLQIPVLIGGSVIMEQIFVLPGMGRLMLDALSARDYPIVSGVNLVIATVVLAVNLLVDLTYAWLDPRIRYR
jgi:peptide/nickel transport system permease protein